MADVYKKISDFLQASAFGDNDLLLVSQSGVTKVIKGTALKAYAQQAGENAAKINSAEVNASGNLILTTTDGTSFNAGKVDGEDGISVTGASINSQYHLILTFSDGSTKDAGYCRGASGAGTGDMQGADYDADNAVKAAGGIKAFAVPTAFTVTLSASAWSGGEQAVSNAAFLATGYQYIVSPTYGSSDAYNKAKVKAKDVSTDGQMTFVCTTVPSVDLSVQILKVRVS